MFTWLRVVCCIVSPIFSPGCASVGPGTIPRDRVDYAEAMATSWKEQTLLNVVKLRYLDTPMYMDISSVVASHELMTEANAGWRFYPTPQSSAQSYRELDVRGRYTDRPTISYVPLAGERFINGQLRPLSAQTVLAMIESGHPANFVLELSARAINDVYNASLASQRARPGSEGFHELAQAMRRIQMTGIIGTRSERHGASTRTYVSFRSNPGGAADADIKYVKAVLGLNPAKQEYLLSTGSYRRSSNEILLLTRSIQEIMVELALGVEVPTQDLSDGRATKAHPSSESFHQRMMIRVRSDGEPPKEVFAKIRYGKHWFWIDDKDLNSKRVMMFLRMFTSLAETGVIPQPAVVTIPTR